MLQYIKNIALLFALCGALTGLVAEQFRLLKHPESVCFNKTDSEKKDNSETKKFGEDDKFQPEELSNAGYGAAAAQVLRRSCHCRTDLPGSADYISILTPPPERV